MRSQISPEVKSESISHENSPAQHTRCCQISLFICENFDQMDGVQAIDVTPTKFSVTNTGCVLCGLKENNSRRRTKLNGKVANLRNRICGILDIPLSSINVEGYICSDRCFRSLKRFEKLQEDMKTLHRTLKEKFVRNNRVKRGVPSDTAMSPSVAAPTKSLRHGEDQRRVKSAKSLSYGEILPKPNPEDVIHVPLTMVRPTLASLDFVVANNLKISSEGHCDGDIWKVQVSLNF